ncbi:MAG TPA: hypothetical protein VG273_23895 [Bryobacteraceae bacterium]|nr:hypothetical protein [Bryobacteraceae bacterium]
MPISPLPTPLQNLGGRRFSFYPPIRNIDHNEWLYRRSTWSESVVVNMQSGDEVCIPRMFIGEVSITEDPVIIVGLTRELEWNAGAVVPHQRRVIELPVAVNDGRPAPARAARPAQVVNIRLEPKREVAAGKWIGVVFALGAVALTVVTNVARQVQTHLHTDLFRTSQAYQQFGPGDDYFTIVAALGVPSSDRSATANGRVYRVLTYPARRFSVVIAGTTAVGGRYAGTIDLHGHVLHSARFVDGSTSEPLLREMPRF